MSTIVADFEQPRSSTTSTRAGDDDAVALGHWYMEDVESESWLSAPATDSGNGASSSVIVFAGTCCVGLATLTVWLRGGLGTDARSYSGLDLPLLALPVAVAAVVAAAAAFMHGVTGRSALRRVGTVAGVVVVALAGLVILTVETVAAVIPDGVFPAAARRLTVELSAGAGLWIALTGGVIIIAGARGWRPGFLSVLAGTARGANMHRALPAIGLVFAATLFGWLRYEPWVGASAAGSSGDLAGWSLPWIGPLSLVALIVLGAALVAAAALRLQLAGLLAAAGGWLITLVAGVVAQASSTFAELRLDELAPASVRQYGPHVELAPATWIAFGTGLLAAAAGAGLLMLSTAPREDTSWALH